MTTPKQSEQVPAKEELLNKRSDEASGDQQHHEGQRTLGQRELELIELILLQADLRQQRADHVDDHQADQASRQTHAQGVVQSQRPQAELGPRHRARHDQSHVDKAQHGDVCRQRGDNKGTRCQTTFDMQYWLER